MDSLKLGRWAVHHLVFATIGYMAQSTFVKEDTDKCLSTDKLQMSKVSHHKNHNRVIDQGNLHNCEKSDLKKKLQGMSSSYSEPFSKD